MYAARGSTVYVNLFVTSRGQVEVDGVRIDLIQETDYPWDGDIRITVRPERPVRMRLMLRLPGWSRGQILGGHLYRFEGPSSEAPRLRVNGAEIRLLSRDTRRSSASGPRETEWSFPCPCPFAK